MKDIFFEANLNWGQENEGKLTGNDKTSITISGPAEMNGKGVGMSPEDLLVGAVSACYIGTLFKLLQKRRLPVASVSVKAEGVVKDYPEKATFKRVTVYPTIHRGELSKQAEYEKWANKARDNCFIGKAIHEDVGYEVGPIIIEE